MPTFFSLTPNQAAEYRQNLFTQIHEIVFHGGGGYDWDTLYSMPIWLRNFTFKKISDHFEAKNKAQRNDPANAQQNKYMDKFSSPSKTSSPKIKTPDFVTSKAKKA